VAGNVLSANLQGVFVEGDGARVHHNVALLNEVGFAIQGSRAVLSSNSALGGVVGFGLPGVDLDIRRNAAIGAQLYGLGLVEPGESRLSKNSVIGNLGGGIFISESVPADIHENNIYGNGSNPWGFGPNCGVINLSGPPPIAAQRNFWGAPNGPGRNPADAICDLQTGDSPLIFSPAARKRFRILNAESLSGRKRSTEQ
jgi:hypothetical protein